MKEGAIPDHSVCLFQKDSDNNWRALDCFSVVELKMSDTSCQEFQLSENGVDQIDVRSKHSALGQVIIYNMRCFLPYHAKRGTLRIHLPLAILAGKRTGFAPSTQNRPRMLQWVSGKFDIPVACGDIF